MKTIGQTNRLPFRVAASATRGYVGEPMLVIPSYTNGVSNVNTAVVMTNGASVIGTNQFLGILGKDSEVNSAGTVVAHRTVIDVPFPNITRIRAKHITAANVDTEAEAIGTLFDIFQVDLTATAYRWEEAGADTHGFEARWFNVTNSELDCIADHRLMSRVDIT